MLALSHTHKSRFLASWASLGCPGFLVITCFMIILIFALEVLCGVVLHYYLNLQLLLKSSMFLWSSVAMCIYLEDSAPVTIKWMVSGMG